MDGAADEPLAELDGQTILEKAHIPHTDWISINGQQGMVHNVPNGFSPGSDVALMSLMGYDPAQYYRGRAPLEAAAQNIQTGPDDWIFRCNLVTVADGTMVDYSAGHIDSVQAATLINELNQRLGSDEIRFYSGVSYRHLMVIRGGKFDMETVPPHDIMDEPIAKYLPKGKNGKKLVQLMEEAGKILADHDVNKVRSDLGENPATGIWLWGQGQKPQLDKFREKFGISGSVITAVDLVRGLGKLMGMEVIEVEGATGYLDTNYAGKGQAAIEALDRHDLVFVHVEAPDEAGHGALVEGKIQSVEQIDLHIVGPLLKHLQAGRDWRILVLPDHPTPIRLRTHTPDPVPFALAGLEIKGTQNKPYCEANGRSSGIRIDRGHELMEYFLKG
jgi:2,3-bisphosphoglycerate-independent phosphoglycerate mutase